MADLKSLSDEELEKIAAQKPAPTQGPVDLSSLSDDELAQIALGMPKKLKEPEPPRTFTDAALQGISAVGKKINSYTLAPVLKGIGDYQDSGDVSKGLEGYINQFGENPDLAPTGQQIVQKAGISDRPLIDPDMVPDPLVDPEGYKALAPFANISRSGAAGFALEVAADPLNVLPLGLAGKGIGKTAELVSAGAKAAGKTSRNVKAVDTVVTAAEKAAEAASATTKSIQKLFTPKQADDFGELVQIAEKNSINPELLPEAVEFGHSSIITRGARAKAEGVRGQEALEKFYEGYSQVQDATNRKITQIAKGTPTGKVEAGQGIRQAFDEAFDNILAKDALTYRTVQKYAPGLQINRGEFEKLNSALNGVEKWAKGRAIRGISETQREQARQLMSAISAIRQSKRSFKQTVEAMDMIGDVAFKSTNTMADIPADVQKMRKIYFDMRDAVTETIRKELNPEFADELIANNKLISQLYGDRSIVSGVVGNKQVAPERVFESLVLNGDTQKIAALKRVLKPNQLQQIKGAFLENLIKRDADGGFNFKTFFNAMRNKRTVMEALFAPQEIQEMLELVKLGDRFGQPILSTSGTGASMVFKDIANSVQEGVLNDTVLEMLKQRARNPAPASRLPTVEPIETINSSGLRPPPAARPGLALPRASRVKGTLKGLQLNSIERSGARRPADEDKGGR